MSLLQATTKLELQNTTQHHQLQKRNDVTSNFDGIQWDKEEILQYLETKDEKVVWSTVAQEHGIEGHNTERICSKNGTKQQKSVHVQ